MNIMVVTVFLFLHKLGSVGALGIATVALGFATVCMMTLYLVEEKEAKERANKRWKKAIGQVQVMSKVKKQWARKSEEEKQYDEVQEKRQSFASCNVTI